MKLIPTYSKNEKTMGVLNLFPHIQITDSLYLVRHYTYKRKKFALWFLIKIKESA